MYDQRLSNRENYRELEGVSAPPAINIRVHRNEGNMPSSRSRLEVTQRNANGRRLYRVTFVKNGIISPAS